jgi:molybdopterin-containing oxidoreductase family iron-sulfur binding subunit
MKKLPVVRDSDPVEIDRRELMKLLAAGTALATGALGGCMEAPHERIMPRVDQPPEMTPGVPLYYATSMVLDGFATGLVARVHEGRPTKLDGNPDHPASLGGSLAYHQAAVLELYDPDRPKVARRRGGPVASQDVLRDIAARADSPGLWFLMHPQTSPLVADQIAAIRARHPEARFVGYSPIDRRGVYEGAKLAFGRPLECQYHLDKADIVVALDADFLATMPNATRWARDFATRRRPVWPLEPMSRLYVAEARPTPTGTLADHRLAVPPSRVTVLANALHAVLTGGAEPATVTIAERAWVARAAEDLRENHGKSLVVVGDRQPAAVHAVVHAINDAIGAFAATLDLTEPARFEPLGGRIEDLVAAIRGSAVQTLVIVDADPLRTAPYAADVLARVPETICASVLEHETARHCDVFVPLAHFLESWGDARAYDGTLSIVQPVIRPMYDSVGLVELLAAFAGAPHASAHDLLVQRHRANRVPWERVLQLGVVPDTASPPVDATPRHAAPADVPRHLGIELAFDVSPVVYDGRFAHIAWLQELPKPVDKITWGNVAMLGPATAARFGVSTEDVVRLGAIELPAFVMPGHAEDCVSLELGYGGKIGANVSALVHGGPVTVLRTGAREQIARTQTHFDQEGRDIARLADLAAYTANPDFTADQRGPQQTMLPAGLTSTVAWGMTIDTSLCTGCSACVVACVAENNIPVVGKQGVLASREMHWIRIDTYREDDGEVINQPMACQHCEDAPCEYVCPTYATQHSPDGLNEMTYNRCIGTRFCSNNCPYKVRRFNWFDYTEGTPPTERLQRNPNVTVRARGVMEKCTFCVQRIRGAEIDARKEHREIRPGEVETACQQACPTRAIEFGSLTHAGTPVVALRDQPRTYFVLHELGTRPRTAYLAKIRNRKP